MLEEEQELEQEQEQAEKRRRVRERGKDKRKARHHQHTCDALSLKSIKKKTIEALFKYPYNVYWSCSVHAFQVNKNSKFNSNNLITSARVFEIVKVFRGPIPVVILLPPRKEPARISTSVSHRNFPTDPEGE